MSTNQINITTYGQVSNKVYDDVYMDYGALMTVNGITYEVVDFNNNREGHGLNALLLKDIGVR